MQCVILVGGLGSRLRSVTGTVPKHLAVVNGSPFADLQLGWLRTQGVERVTYSLGHLGGVIREYVGDGKRFGLHVDYVDEGEDLRGTGGALGLAGELGSLEEQFLLMYGDSLLNVDLSDVWACFRSHGGPALMTVYENRGRLGLDNVLFENGRILRYSKSADSALSERMQHIDYGLLALSRDSLLEFFPPEATGDLAPYLEQLSSTGQLDSYLVNERFYEIGTPESLLELERHLANLRASRSSHTVRNT